MKTILPKSISTIIGDRIGTTDSTGCSGSTVILYPDMVLKITPSHTPDASRIMLPWLDGKLPAPKILADTTADGKAYLLMSRIRGEMSCAPEYLNAQDTLFSALGSALRMLDDVAPDGCPRVCSLDRELQEAAERLESGKVTPENAHPGTFGPGGFPSPEALLNYLVQNRPDEQLVFTHGDFCLPNLLLNGNQVSGFIDFTHAGLADRYRDLASCYMSLVRNFNGSYGGPVYADFNPDRLFDYLDFPVDREKLRYYMLLDAFF